MFLETGDISIIGPRTLKQFEVTHFLVLSSVEDYKVSVDVTFERILSYHLTNTFIPTLRYPKIIFVPSKPLGINFAVALSAICFKLDPTKCRIFPKDMAVKSRHYF